MPAVALSSASKGMGDVYDASFLPPDAGARKEAAKKYVPFNADDGWHVPNIIYETMKERQCQVFTSSKTKNGVTMRQGKLIKEFAIEVLPPLTEEELKDLAQRQALAQSIG